MYVNILLLTLLTTCIHTTAGTTGNDGTNKRLLQDLFQFHTSRAAVSSLFASMFSDVEDGKAKSQDLNDDRFAEDIMDMDREAGTEDELDAGSKAQNSEGVLGFEYDMQAVSETCIRDIRRVIIGVQQNETWALKVFDAFGKPGSDIMGGELGWLGSFDECLAVEAPGNDVSFRVRYCSATLSPDGLNQSFPNPSTTPRAIIMIGLCMPESCSVKDIGSIASNVLTSQNISLQTAIVCHQRDYQLDTDAKVAIVIFSIFACLVVLGTGYDVIFPHLSKILNTLEKIPGDKYYGSTAKVTIDNTDKRNTHQYSVLVEESEKFQKDELHVKVGNRCKAKLSNLLMIFSAYTNGAKLLNTKQPTGSLTAIHGIRVISITWIILGHTFSGLPVYASNVAPYLSEHIKRWTFQAIINTSVSVDTFFTLSGLLVTYLTLKELKREGGKLNWFMFYFHRFWRLTPVYMMVLMFYACLFHYLADGPMWVQTGFVKEECRENWWTNLLYVNNLVNMNKQCFLWAWYLANDMQFYILSPLVILPMFHSEFFGMIVLGIFLVGSVITTGIISRLNNHSVGILYDAVGTRGAGTYLGDTYSTPYCRVGPYLVGMLAGYVLYKYNGKVNMSQTKAVIVWLGAAASALAVLYGPYESANGSPMTYEVAALYNALFRTVWGAVVSWVVIACVSGYGGYINTFLSWNGFVPLSRLTYCAYLIHPMVITLQINSMRNVFYLNDINITFNYLGFILATYAVSVIVCLTFEVPMMGLEKGLLHGRREKNK